MSPRILVVDDDHAMRRILQELLEDEGYEVDSATDGLDALEKLDQQRIVYDVILQDLGMPRMDGLQFVQGLRPRNPEALPSIIALSGDVAALLQTV